MAVPTWRDDARALAASILVVPLVWLGLGWRPALLVSGYDAVSALLPVVQALVAAHGDPSTLAFRPELLGGVALRDTLGPQPLLLLPAAFGLTAAGVLNFATFATQGLFAFFGQRVAGDLAALLGHPRPNATWRVATGVLLLAFGPFVGWRVGYGHLTLLVGLLPFLAALGVVTARAAASSNAFLLGAAGLTVALGLPFAGQQIVLNGAVFGLPLLLGIWRVGGRPVGALGAPAVVLLSGVLLALPGFAPMVAHALGGDALRELGGPTMTYSYLTAGPLDWLTSLPWARPVAGARPEIQLHESNAPFGPLLLLLALTPRRGRPILWGLATSAALAMAFASNLRPLSDALLWLVPPLRSFRVPTRALFPLLALLPLLASAVVAGLRPDRADSDDHAGQRRLGLAGGLVLAGVALFTSPLPREILGWLAAAAMVTLGRRAGVFAKASLAPALGLCLVGGSLGAFRERLLPFPDAAALLREARLEGEHARSLESQLGEPLTRVALATEGRALGANRAFAAGLSSLDGYGFPQRRFVALVRSLRGEPYSPNALLLRFRPEYAPSRVLFQLYHVAFALDDPGPSVRRLAPTAGPAWFPRELRTDADLAATTRALLAWGDETHAQARQVLRVVGTEPSLRGVELGIPPLCSEAAVLALDQAVRGFGISVRTPERCPLVVALNYGETLEAWGEGRLRTFPAYGALLGIDVPAGTDRVEIRPRVWPPPFTLPLAAAGLGLLLSFSRR